MSSSIYEKIAREKKEAKIMRREAINKAKETVETVMVRARTAAGHYVADNPDTPENEAWEEKKLKEITQAKAEVKKKTTKKAKKKS